MHKLHTNSRFPIVFTFVLAVVTIALSGCASTSTTNSQPWLPTGQKAAAEQSPNELLGDGVQEYNLDDSAPGQLNNTSNTVKVAILLPLSGKHEKLGQAMLNGAQMALFDLGFSSFELLPKDTRGTPQGAAAAAQSALNDGARLVLGPIFSHSVKAARQVTQAANVNMIAFSTDWTLANKQTYLIGFLPFDQIERVTRYAAASGYKHMGVLSPTGSYGDGVVSAYQAIAQNAGVEASRIERFNPKNNLTATMRGFTDYDARKAANNKLGAPYDAVLMPVGGPLARQVGSFLNHYDMPPQTVRRIGTGLMDDPSLASDRSLDGAWFAAPAPSLRRKFERRYGNAFAVKPPRIASLAYDATALSIILAHVDLQNGRQPSFNTASITNPNGFAGVDGIFRFRRDGIVERGLAILEFKNGGIVVVNDAPSTFQTQGF